MMPYLPRSARPGLALMEVVVALAVLVVFAAAFARLTVGSYDGSRQARQQTVAVRYAQEGLEATRAIARQDFSLLIDGTYGIDDRTGIYTLSGASNIIGGYTRTVTIDTLERDGNDDIVASGGTEDEDSKSVTTNVSWSVSDGRSNTVNFVTYLMNWKASATQWFMDTLADFQEGFMNGTERTENNDGEVRLRTLGNVSDASIYLTRNLSGNGNPADILIDPVDDRLYMSTSNDNSYAEIWIYDIADISSSILTLTGSLEVGNNSNGLALDDGYLFALSDANDEIRVFDLSDLSIVANWDIPTSSNPMGITVNHDADELYVVTETSTDEEFYRIDISNPEVASIQIVDTAEIIETGNDLALYSDTHIFIGTNGDASELLIVPLDDPDSFSTCNFSGTEDFDVVHIEGTRLFIGETSGSTEFSEYAINPSDPTNCSPTLVGSTNLNDDALAIAIDTSTNTAFITSSSNDVSVIDLDDFSSSNIDTGSSCSAVGFYSTAIYVGCDDNSDTFRVLRGGQGGWSELSAVGYGTAPGNDNATAVFAAGDYVYLGTAEDTNDDEFFIFDMSGGPSNGMTAVGSLEVSADINDIFVVGNYAYLGTNDSSSELIVVDISTPASPSEAGSMNLDDDVFAVYVIGTTVYAVTDSSKDDEFFIIDATTPGSMSEIGTYNVGADANGVWVSGNYAYLATDQNSQELLVLDISTPSSPSFADDFDASGNSNGEDIWIEGSVAYFVTQDDFYTISISTPTNVAQLDTLDFGNANRAVSVNADQNLAFIATGETNAELRVVSVADPSNISETQTIDIPGNDNSDEIYAAGDYIFIASIDNTEELRIYGAGTASPTLAHHGSYTSPVFDSETASANWQEMSWTVSGSSSNVMRLRTGNNLANLLQARFVGNDGTSNTVYTQSGGQSITVDPNATGTRFIQWKAYFSGSGAETPILEDVTLTFQ